MGDRNRCHTIVPTGLVFSYIQAQAIKCLPTINSSYWAEKDAVKEEVGYI